MEASTSKLCLVPPMGAEEIKYYLAKRKQPPKNFAQFARKYGVDPSMASHVAHGRATSGRLEQAFARELGLTVEQFRRLRAA